ncbi:DUF2946 family protein [Methylocystis heyeri]|uniref:DUF2946 domain-containing protein n=1 Tax=Methylocystis heyeri TaxID=391905 RepID=A0A6B8KDP7_9HYPH|nr:DUF2946 family protein [Methylocystis heyeri]QGM44678.1 hypothetical protein H2LOC_002675 [Methylocystis heyeri]
MPKVWGTKTGSARAALATVAICLLVLKALVLAPLQSGSAAQHWGLGAPASLLAVDCAATGAPGDGKVPAPTSHHHDACAFCLVRHHAAAFGAAISPAALVFIVPHAPPTTLGRPALSDSRTPSRVWFEARSPRGPPIFS